VGVGVDHGGAVVAADDAGGIGLEMEAGSGRGVRGDGGVHGFQRQDASAGGTREIDGAHAAVTEPGEQVVAAISTGSSCVKGESIAVRLRTSGGRHPAGFGRCGPAHGSSCALAHVPSVNPPRHGYAERAYRRTPQHPARGHAATHHRPDGTWM
jgi:hypothetical protein